MPLIVPGVNSSLGNASEWTQKLVGKKISESTSDVNVLLADAATGIYLMC